ncbi:Ig-like domain-containing protein [Gorillibacterium sp. sgz500922]|uniref:Ig-like domain-containing protein n=1 Tax=Gorillibacterium sp. sgz500922 TaxID=3446694 RepID=UPI003F679D55
MRKYTIPILTLVCFGFFVIGCGTTKNLSGNTNGSSNTPVMTKAEPSDWIVATKPGKDEADVDEQADIEITFGQDMNPDSLNETNILVLDGKHGDQMIQSLFKFHYEKSQRKLSLELPEDTGYGSSNGIEVRISGNVENARHETMGSDYQFGFLVK